MTSISSFPKLCGVALTVQDCYPTQFSDFPCFETLTSSVFGDQSIRVFGDWNDVFFPSNPLSNNCFFKKYSGYNINDEIWVKSCDAMNQNPNKAGKYRFGYAKTSGMIYSQGSLVSDSTGQNIMCLRINSNSRFFKQRVRIAPCDSNDALQKFDFIDGRIYSRDNHRLCAGFEWNKFVSSGDSIGSPLIFSTCYPNTWAVFQ